MKNDRDTKEKLLAAGKKEFLEKGYMKASLRNICKSAGVTTGALYFFFKDKEDLFACLVEEPIGRLYEVINPHFMDEINQAEGGMKADFTHDLEAARQIIHLIYQYYDEFILVIIKSQGSRFEHIVDRFVEASERHYRKLVDKIAGNSQEENLDDYMIHWFSHMQVDIFVHMLTHEKSEEEALKHMDLILKYLVSGWFGMFH